VQTNWLLYNIEILEAQVLTFFDGEQAYVFHLKKFDEYEIKTEILNLF